jgi:hypothetical protein
VRHARFYNFKEKIMKKLDDFIDLWLPFGSLLAPFGSLLAPFECQTSSKILFFVRFGFTFC